MEARVILDAGPLVAYLGARDMWHDWAVEEFTKLSSPLVCCEAVITEACFLLKHFPRALDMIHNYLRDGVITITFALDQHHGRVFDLMRKYRNVPMSIADACVVCMAEDLPQSRVFTLDSDFQIYRLRGRSSIPLIHPG